MIYADQTRDRCFQAVFRIIPRQRPEKPANMG
jgi:hypothetical protein